LGLLNDSIGKTVNQTGTVGFPANLR